MQRKSVRRVSKSVHSGPATDLASVRLDDIVIFTLIAKHGSVRKAALASDRQATQMARRLDVFEHQTGKTLFHRTNKGMMLTDAGNRMYPLARDFVERSNGFLGYLSKQNDARDVSVVGVTEGLGTFWLMPRLVDFNRNNPSVLIDFRCQMQPADLHNYDADISVQLEPPQSDNVIVTRIGYLHVMLFASLSYKNTHGVPSRLQELPDYHLVEQQSAQIDASVLAKMFPDIEHDFISMKTNTSSSHAYAIARGAGIGALPTYARAITSRLIPVCPEFHFSKPIYLCYLKGAGKVAHNRKVIDWLKASFDPKNYPWFAEGFVHPDEFETNIRSDNIVRMFDGFDQ